MSLSRTGLLFLATAVLALAGASPPKTVTPSVGSDALERAPSRFASYGGYRVHYKSLGAGRRAVVFIHGWTCDANSWRLQVPAFAGKTRVIALDLPGHGESDKPQLAYTMSFFALAVEDVLREAGVDRAILVGHSMGTPVARQFYRMYPGRTAALVAVDGPLKPLFTDPAAAEKFLAPFRGPLFRDAQRRMLEALVPPATPPSLREEIARPMLAAPQHVVVSAMEGILDPDAWKDDRIEVPLLVVVARGPASSEKYEADVRALGPDVEYRVLEGVGHFLMLEKPSEFNSIVTGFLVKRGLL